MAIRQKMDKALKRSAILTLRLTQAEMLTFKLAALNLRRKRSQLMRERVADLIGIAHPDNGGSGPAGEAQDSPRGQTQVPIVAQADETVAAV